VFPDKDRGGFSKKLENKFWKLSGLRMRKKKHIIHVNQLSESKIYSHAYVNKSITALFKVFGIYCAIRIFPILYCKVPHVSVKTGTFHK